MKTVIFALVVISLVAFAPAAHATNFTCNPINVASFANRVHVQCGPGAGVLVFFAVSTANPATAQRFVEISTAALVNNKSLLIQFDPANATGPSFGCAINNCRPAASIFINK
ncbi:MAG TPA: hypothetical protein VFN10_21720 [Thermoanaerobaculia bacterium]|nr:hypothetical protein [Thermoanaerobaculia bacterium]